MSRHANINKAYRLARRADGQIAPVPETAQRGKPARSVQALAVLALCGSLASTVAAAAPPPVSAQQLPSGGALAAGQASWSSQGNTLTVQQNSQRAVINWQKFDLGSNARVVFNQAQGRNAAILNRVLDNQPSQILGRMEAPGQVFISNPYGVIFGAGARVDVGSLVATSLSSSDADFMAGGRVWQRQGALGAVSNAGQLTAQDGGYVALLAPEVRNEGVVLARAGTVALAAGESVELQFAGLGLSGIKIDPAALKTLVENRQALLAPDGMVLMSARSADQLRSGVVNQQGRVSADSLRARGGRVFLEADQIQLGEASRIDARGATGGGQVLVGGGWQGSGDLHQASSVSMKAGAQIDVSATHKGDGGQAVLWSRVGQAGARTEVQGRILAQGGEQGGAGGQVETSGHALEFSAAQVKASARVKGEKSGQWLLDPGNVNVGTAEAASLVSALQGGTDTVLAAVAGGGEAGDLTVASKISWSSAAKLTLSADRHLTVNAPISASSGSLVLNYGQGQVAAGNTAQLGINAPIDLSAGPNYSTKQGSNGSTLVHTVITSLGTASSSNDGSLQGLVGNLSGRFVLGANIDASATSGWNSGAGFNPIGLTASPFTGSFDGLGHVVSNLTIQRPGATDVGLFGSLGSAGKISNVGVVNANIRGYEQVATLVGFNQGLVTRSFGTGTVQGRHYQVGGLVGHNLVGATVSYSYATASVTGQDAGNLNIGGLVGGNGGVISNSFATGAVSGNSNVGGLTGYQNGWSGAGGPVRIINSFASGTATGSSATGALWGAGADNGSVTSSAGGINPLNAASFTGWDFTKDWVIYNGRTTPLLPVFMRPLTVSSAVSSKTYDRTANLPAGSIVYSEANTAGHLQGSVVVSGLGSNVGSYSLGLSGLYSDQQGFKISYEPVSSFTVTPAPLTVSGAVAASKTYDRSPAATVSGGSLQGVIAGDEAAVSLVAGSASFANANAGKAKAVSTGFTLSGSAAGNYSLSQPTGLSADINPAALTVTGAVAASKTYDRSPAATVSGGSLQGVIAGDEAAVSLVAGSASFANANAGKAKAVSTGFTLSGSAAGNYSLSQPTGLSADINPAALTVTGAVAASKTYDGSTAATISGASLQGLVSGDQGAVSLVAGNASFANANAGTAKPVSAAFTLSGAAAGNYTLSQPSGLSADIRPAPVSIVGAQVASKVYDGQTSATLSGATLQGVLPADQALVSVQSSNARFADANVGQAKPVTASFALQGTAAGNYSLQAQPSLAGDITQLAQVQWVGANSGDWFTASNWAGGAVPTLSNVAKVIIPEQVSVTLSSSGANAQPAPSLSSVTGGGNLLIKDTGLKLSGGMALNALTLSPEVSLTAGNLALNQLQQEGGLINVAGNTKISQSIKQSGGTLISHGVAQIVQSQGDAQIRTLAANGLSIKVDAGNLQFHQLASAGDAQLSASGSVQQGAAGALVVQGKTSVQAGAAIALDAGSNSLVGGVDLKGGKIALKQSQGDLTLGAVQAKEALSVQVDKGQLRQAEGGSVQAQTTAEFRVPQGAIDLSAKGNQWGAALTLQGGDISVTQASGDLKLAAVAASGNLSLSSSAGIAQSAAWTVAGRTQLDAPQGKVDLSNSGNDFVGPVSVKSAALQLQDGRGGLSLGSVSSAGALQVNSSDGSIQQLEGATLGVAPGEVAVLNARQAGVYVPVQVFANGPVIVNGELLSAPGTPSLTTASAAAVNSAPRPAAAAAASMPQLKTSAAEASADKSDGKDKSSSEPAEKDQPKS